MAPKKKVQSKSKIKKKKWMPLIAPKIFNYTHIGDTHISDDEQVLRKSMSLNLMTVLNDMRKQGYAARFDVTEIKDGKAHTALVGLTMTPSAIKRLIRRGRDKIEDSFLARLKTDQIVRVKPVIVTTNRCSKAAQTDIRLAVRQKLKEILKANTLDGFAREVIDVKLQRVLKDVCNKHHPTRSVDIRAVILLPKEKSNLKETQQAVEEELENKEKEAAERKAARLAAREAKVAKPESKPEAEPKEKPEPKDKPEPKANPEAEPADEVKAEEE